ncbi:MAG: InlB B-repeat-containing protein [Oscillospiraceae bacterium]|nr:InlB B-repeat-containing protein [Oscillospiraceae bacterium]
MKKIVTIFLAVVLCFGWLPVITPPVRAIGDTPIATISAGASHSAAVQKNGSLWMWGNNSNGRLGNGNTIQQNKPIKIMDGVASVSAGNSHTMAVKTDRTLWAWGFNGSGQLGNGNTIQQNKPVKIMDGVASVSTGNTHTMAVKTDGSLWAWGNNSSGQLGDVITAIVPMRIMSGVAYVSSGGNHTLALRTNGSLWAWGNNGSGQLGDGTTISKTNPLQIMSGVESISAGGDYSMAIKTDGSLWAWGNNSSCQLGDGTKDRRTVPVKIMDGVKTVSSGNTHTMVVKKDKTLWAWGSNTSGQLGDSTMIDREKPKKIMDNIYTVSAGASYTTAVKIDGSLIAWGANGSGQLGDATIIPKTAAVRILPIGSFRVAYTVNFNANGGSGVPAKLAVDYGRKITGVNNPARTGFSFDGWYSGNTKINLGSFTVTTDITLTARWKAAPKVTFVTNGGSTVAPVFVTAGSKIIKPKNPILKGYGLVGWYKDPALKKRWNFNKDTVSKSITLYAKWAPKLVGGVSIKGKARLGKTLKANTSKFNAKRLKYQWKRDGKTIKKATKAKYKIKKTDIGKKITVTVKATGYSGSIPSKSIKPVSAAKPPAKKSLKIGNGSNLMLDKGIKRTLKTTGGSGAGKATWKSSDSSIVKINKKSGKITTIKAGVITITAKKSGETATIKIMVK